MFLVYNKSATTVIHHFYIIIVRQKTPMGFCWMNCNIVYCICVILHIQYARRPSIRSHWLMYNFLFHIILYVFYNGGKVEVCKHGRLFTKTCPLCTAVVIAYEIGSLKAFYTDPFVAFVHKLIILELKIGVGIDFGSRWRDKVLYKIFYFEDLTKYYFWIKKFKVHYVRNKWHKALIKTVCKYAVLEKTIHSV